MSGFVVAARRRLTIGRDRAGIVVFAAACVALLLYMDIGDGGHTKLFTFTIVGIVTGCIYALTASGLVVTYTTSGIFNFAHGAIGMAAAFMYWQLWIAWGVPQLVAFLLVLVVIAPLFGAFVELVLMRRLYGASVGVTLVVTLGLLLTLVGAANIAWKPTHYRLLPAFFPHDDVAIGGVRITYHSIIVVGIAIVVAAVLRVFFKQTRIGIAMRAVVDNRDLAAMAGARPARVSQLSWALGSMLAALAGMLIAPLGRFEILTLTLLVVSGYAAAIVGRLRNLPLTVAGGLLLGLADSYVTGYLHGSLLTYIKLVLPMILLFVVLVVMRQDRLRLGTIVGRRMPRVPSLRESLIAAAVFVGLAIVLSRALSSSNIYTGSQALAIGFIGLSLMLLTGYGGQVSLCQMTFVGLGAYAMSNVGNGSLLGVLAAIGIAGAAGAVVAVPTLRLRGLYLALATLAFAAAMDQVFFARQLGYGGIINVPRVHFFGLHVNGDRAFFVLLAVVFALGGIGVLSVRRSHFGRRLAALNDSPAACATLGMNINWTKLSVFVLSAAMAGLGGALYGGSRGSAGPDDFQMLLSLVILLLVTVGGVNTVSGVFLAGLIYAIYPVLQHHIQSLAHLNYLLTGLAAITLGRNPYGIGGELADAGAKIREGRKVNASMAVAS